jgi:superfamily II DNA helicase RecQ
VRAIAEEMKIKVSAHYISVQFLSFNDQIKSAQFYVTTIEMFNPNILMQLKNYWIVFDEFHLIYMWEGFRPKLTELWYEIFLSSAPLLLLSATISQQCLDRLIFESDLNQRELYLLDYGNFRHRFKPKYSPLPNERALFLSLTKNVTKEENSLLFCSYRNQVRSLVDQFQTLDIASYSCVGGEAAQFTHQLNQYSANLFIATSVLSHGVNLPTIKHVYFLQKANSPELDLQMQTRGGRDGSGYIVYFILKYSALAWFNYLRLMGEIILQPKLWSILSYSRELSSKKFLSKKKICSYSFCCELDRRFQFIFMAGKAVVKLIVRVNYNWEIFWSFISKHIVLAFKVMSTVFRNGT